MEEEAEEIERVKTMDQFLLRSVGDTEGFLASGRDNKQDIM